MAGPPAATGLAGRLARRDGREDPAPGQRSRPIGLPRDRHGTDGHKEVLGLWLDGSEGAKFWLKVCSELENRGVEDILIACCDGLKGFPDRYVSFKDHRSLAAAPKPVYTAASEDVAASALDAFEAEWAVATP